jgi:hypothetical protein
MFQIGGTPKPPAPGRKEKPARKPALVTVTVKLEPRLKEKFDLLGGEAWLREQVEQARIDSAFDAS